MKKERIYFFSAIIIVIFSFLIYKLSDIQLISTESYGPDQINLLDKSVEQRSSEIVLSDGRGYFLDRNGLPLNQYETKDVVIFPFIQNIDLPDDLLILFNQINPNWLQFIQKSEDAIYLSDLSKTEIDQETIELVKNYRIPGIVVVDRIIPKDQTLATHLLGVVRSNEEEFIRRHGQENHNIKLQPIGISGLQKTFDSFLISENKQKLMYHVDGKGQPLLGMDLRYQGKGDNFYPVKIQTTIDSEVQAMAESVFDKHNVTNGGMVLLDINSREVLSMISMPKINAQNPYADNSIKNQMLTTQFPGSVFKIVVAAAAIEQNQSVLEQTYDCNKNLYADEPASRQLGELTFDESFALSCNYTFGQVAQQLLEQDNQILEKYAEKLGVLGPVGWKGNIFHYNDFKQFPEEETGRVWGNEQDRHVERAIIQTAIGQKEVKVTPLAVANMISTIVNNGVKGEVKVVDEILYNNGTTMTEFNVEDKYENRIKEETALRLKQLMTKVVDGGTGSRFQGLKVAGKSGTAETGIKNRHNHWFVGYFPTDNPKYALAVVDLKQSSEKAKNYDVFYDIVSNLIDDNRSPN